MNMETAYCSHIENGTYHLDRGDGVNTMGVVTQVFPGRLNNRFVLSNSRLELPLVT